MKNLLRDFRWVFLLLPILLLGGTGWAVVQEAGQAEQLLKTAEEIIPEVVQIRGLNPKLPIEKKVASREEISRFLNEHVQSRYRADQLRNEGVLLKLLGLIPPGMDYREFALKLLTEQVGGFYDPEKKTLFLADWLSPAEQKPVLVHEFTHALQDQYFDLEKIFEQDREAHNDDRLLAHQALAEGDATGVMFDFMLRPLGRNFLQLPDMVFVMHEQFAAMNPHFEVFSSAPEYLKETMLFPYGYGLAFLQKVRSGDKPWSEVDRIFADLPESTEQIIHPEKYTGNRDHPVSVEVEDPAQAAGSGWKIVYKNVLGEFSLYLMLKQHLTDDQAKRAAAGWGGDQVVLLEKGDPAITALLASTVWDTQDDADQFYLALSQWLQARYPDAAKLNETTDALSIRAGETSNWIRRQGTRIDFALGLPESQGQEAKGQRGF